MINQSHAPRFTDDQITQHRDAILRAGGPSMRPYTLLKYREVMRPAVRAIEVAMLVKLHAPVFDERVAFKRGERTYLIERDKEDDYVAPAWRRLGEIGKTVPCWHVPRLMLAKRNARPQRCRIPALAVCQASHAS